MLKFAKQHCRALFLVFAGALAAFLAIRGAQWMIAARNPAPFEFLQLALSMPGAWILGTLTDPLLWKLPRPANLAIFEVLVAAGFAINAVLLTLLFWHRRATGRWWGGDEAAGVDGKTR